MHSGSNHAHAAYELEAVGRYGVVEHFEKPWALTAVMFLGMSLCLPVAYYHKLREQDEHQQHIHAGPVQQPILRRVRCTRCVSMATEYCMSQITGF